MGKNTEVIQWEAEEYVSHEKNMGWYLGLVIIGVILMVDFYSFNYCVSDCFNSLFGTTTKKNPVCVI